MTLGGIVPAHGEELSMESRTTGDGRIPVVLIIALASILASACEGSGSRPEEDTSSDTVTEDTLDDVWEVDPDPDVGADTTPDVEPDAGSDTVDAPDVEDSLVPDADVDVTPDGVTELPTPGTHTESAVVDGVSRSWIMYVPVSAVTAMASGPVPLLIALHGAGDNGSNFIVATGLTATADANGFVVAGPNGYNAGWFVQTEEGWPGTDGYSSSMQNDTDLMFEIIDVAQASYGVDASHVYAVGHSRGAGFTGLLAMLSGQFTTSSGPYTTPFAAYGVNAGYDAAGGTVSPSVSTPRRPVWVIHGTSDSVVPHSYGQGFADALDSAGWDVTWTSVSGGPHTWLWQPAYGHSNQDLWDFLSAY